MKVLVIVHVFYPQFWAELLPCVRTVGPDADVIVTYVDETAVTEARRDLPEARFLRCENRGFDVLPFLCALRTVELAQYDVVVKLHTKRDFIWKCDFVFNHCRFNDARWRHHLLAFCRTPSAWRRTLACLRKPGVGMVADRHVIIRRRDLPWPVPRQCFDAAVAEIRSFAGCRSFDAARAQYVAGTMFAVRAQPLALLLTRDFAAAQFEASNHDCEERMLRAHVVENLLGLAVSAVGLRLAAFNGPLWWRRLYAPARRFFFRVKETRRRRLYKVLGVTVAWRNRKGSESA